MNRILVIEDDASLAELIGLTLRTVGYDVTTAGSARAGLSELNGRGTDLLILDLTLPDRDGLGLLPEIRSKRIPVIILSARDTVRDKVQGLESGADDYLTKPFSMRELLARVKALLRRVDLDRKGMAEDTTARKPAAKRLDFDDLTIDLGRGEARLKGEALHLKPKEYDLLVFLARNRGIVLSRDLILERVWGWDFGGGTRTVDVHVRWLREKIEAKPAEPERIVTVRGVGYRFEG